MQYRPLLARWVRRTMRNVRWLGWLSIDPNSVKGQARRNSRNNSSHAPVPPDRSVVCSHFGCKTKLLALWVREQNHLLASGPMPARDDHGVAPASRPDATGIGGQTAARAQLDRPPGIGRTAPRCGGVLLAVQSVWGRSRENGYRADAPPDEDRDWATIIDGTERVAVLQQNLPI